MSRTIILKSVTRDKKVELARVEQGSLSIGRDPENGLVVDSASVSRFHAAIIKAGSQWVFQDLGSTNGSWVNGEKVNLNQIKLLRDNDIIQLSDFTIIVEGAVDEKSSSEQIPCSVLLFYKNSFQGEYTLINNTNSFNVGGPNNILESESDLSETPVFSISYIDESVNISLLDKMAPISINKEPVNVDRVLEDKDEVFFRDFQIIINDANKMKFMDMNSISKIKYNPLSSSHSSFGQIPEEATESSSPLFNSWDLEPVSKGVTGSQKFLFGSIHDEDDPAGTMSYRQEEFQARAGLGGMSMSQRISSYNNIQMGEETNKAAVNDSTFAIVGVSILLILALVILGIVNFL